MAVDFETPTVALFARLTDIPGIALSTRRLESWDDTPPVQQPALMMVSGPITTIEQNQQLPPLFKVTGTIVLYVKAPDPNVAPSTILNPLVSEICNAFLRQPIEPPVSSNFVANQYGYATTLGGLVAYCRVSGTIGRDEGLIGGVAAASIPFEMVCTS